MNENEKATTVVREWVRMAEGDLAAASATLRLAGEESTEAICFHAQQVVEKYMKAVLIARAVRFPRTHDLGEMTALLPRNDRTSLSADELDKLTRYAALTRYPGDYQPLTLVEARRAVSLARRVRAEMRKRLPREALRRAKK